MANRQIGWSQESNLLWQIGNQIDRFEKVIFTSLSNTVPSSRTLTINGVTYDLSANRTWTVSGGIGGTIATGQVAFGSATNTISGTNNLFWDAANNRLGINNSTPLFSADITGTARISGATLISPVSTINTYNYFSTFNVVNDGPASIAIDRFSNNTTSPHFNLRKSRGTTTTPIIIQTNDELGYVGFWGHDGTNFQRNGIILTQAQNVAGTTITPVMRFGVGANAGLSQYYINLHNTGNTIFGPSATVDTGQRVQIIGDTKIIGSGITGSTNGLLVQNSNSENLFKLRNDGVLVFGNIPSQFPYIVPINGSSTAPDVNSGSHLYFNSLNSDNSNASPAGFWFNSSFLPANSGNPSLIKLTGLFSPSAGISNISVLDIQYTINQLGTATGVTRGLHIRPVLTAANEWRSIQWDNSTGWGLFGVGTADNFLGGGLLINGVLRETITTNRQTASYTLALADRGKLVEMNVATANNLTVPLDSAIAFPVGTKIDISQYGAGQTTVVATGGVTIRSAGGALKLAAQYSGGSLVKIATNEWYLFGDITV